MVKIFFKKDNVLKIKLEDKTVLPDATYRGTWCNYTLNIPFEDEEIKFKMEKKYVGVSIVEIEVKNKEIFVIIDEED
jgi:hypothetical protein